MSTVCALSRQAVFTPVLPLHDKKAKTDFDRKDFTNLMNEIKQSPEKALKAHSSSNVDSIEFYIAPTTPPTYSLTNEQVFYLKIKYDFAGMTAMSSENKNFLSDLVAMNVISQDDAVHSFTVPMYEGEGTDHRNNKDLAWRTTDAISRLQKRLEVAVKIADDGSIDEESKAFSLRRVEFLKNSIESRSKLLDLLAKLM